ncbi:hypothetical protein POTOM_001282 [Populus tomentosa]|uniref:NHL domain-containing protein n=1 Tax=Populus tomentosa TaxID=118781 RepID=A0A8X8IYG9_POPTO|nr:hypothetical protein POTOM_001282 [Populus tomentosa]
MSSSSSIIALQLLLFFIVVPIPSLAKKPHVIHFRSPNLYPEGLAYDPSAQHFIVGSLHHRTLHSVSDAGVIETLISDPSLPPNTTILGLAVDKLNNRLLAAIHSDPPLPSLHSTPSPLTTSALFPVDRDAPYSYCGLNGIAYVSKGYLLVVQSNTGKLFKVDAHNGTAHNVLLSEDLPVADGIAIRGDGVVLVVSHEKLWFLKSDDSWGEGVVYDKTDLDVESLLHQL